MNNDKIFFLFFIFICVFAVCGWGLYVWTAVRNSELENLYSGAERAITRLTGDLNNAEDAISSIESINKKRDQEIGRIFKQLDNKYRAAEGTIDKIEKSVVALEKIFRAYRDSGVFSRTRSRDYY